MTELINIPPAARQDLEKQEADANTLLDYLATATINTEEELTKFADQLKETVGHKKRLDAMRKTVTRPLLDAKNAADAMFMPTIKLLGKVETALKRNVADYHTRQAEREAAARAQLAEATDASEHREAVVALSAAVRTPETKGVYTRKKKVLRIDDPAAIPREFMVPDERAILAALKAGIAVPGCVLAEELTMTVRA